jgi:lipopolysaccharide transport system ATP-binding protein
MSNDVLIRAEGVSKRFCRNLKKSLIYGAGDIVKGFFGIEKKQDLRSDEFWAVSDVNFEVRRGECLGLIGHNGAGKSTLLKMLNGLIRPDKGRIEMHGKVGALIELGAGFSPLLTGRENAYNNGAVLGFTKEQIDKKFDEIIEFAELADFIDSPVQNYSSGMKVRLGFAIAAQMEPDILLIDEVLAVGDLGFQAKCFNRINELVGKCAIIFVSHSMPQVARIASEVIHLHRGSILFQGANVGEGIETYYKGFQSEVAQFVGKENSVVINEFSLLSEQYKIKPDGEVKQFSDVEIKINYKVAEFLNLRNHNFVITIYDQSLRGVVMLHSENHYKGFLPTSSNDIDLSIKFNMILAPGKYTLWLYFSGSTAEDSKRYFGYATYQAYFTINVVGAALHSIVPVHLPANWIVN